MSRLTIDITDQQHQSLKALAALQGKTIRQYAIERLFPADIEEDQARDELKALLGRRIAQGLAGDVSARSIGAIIDEELGSFEQTQVRLALLTLLAVGNQDVEAGRTKPARVAVERLRSNASPR